MEIGREAEPTPGGNDIPVMKKEPIDELGFFSSNIQGVSSDPGRDTGFCETLERNVKVEFGGGGTEPERSGYVMKSEDVPSSGLEHSSTDLRSLSESLQEVTTSEVGNPSNSSLVAYGSSDEESENGSNSAPSSSAEDSSPGDSSSLLSSSSSSDSSDEEPAAEGTRQNAREEPEQIKRLEAPPKTKKELMLEDLPQVPFVDFRLGEDEEVSLLGKVSSIIGQLVVVASNRDNPALNEDTVLFKEDRHPIGVVFELFGPVPNPFYTVRFNSTKDITDMGLALGSNIYFAPRKEEITNYVFVKQLEAMKGTDASWADDEEPPPDMIEYSDDEAERAAKKEKMMEKEKRKAARRRDENGSTTDAQRESGLRQRPDRGRDQHSTHQPRHQHQGRGPPEGHHGHGPPCPPFNQRSPHPPFNQRGPHPPFNQRGPYPPIDHRGPHAAFDPHGPYQPFNHGGPCPPFDQGGPNQPPFIHRGPHPPVNHRQQLHMGIRPQEQYNHRGPPPIRQRYPHGPMGPHSERFHQQPWTPSGVPPPHGGGVFHHGGYSHPPPSNGYGGY